MNKNIMTYPFNGTLLSIRRMDQRTTDLCYNVSETQNSYAE